MPNSAHRPVEHRNCYEHAHHQGAEPEALEPVNFRRRVFIRVEICCEQPISPQLTCRSRITAPLSDGSGNVILEARLPPPGLCQEPGGPRPEISLGRSGRSGQECGVICMAT